MDRDGAVARIRSFNRFYTNILGLLNRHILDSDFSMTEARVLLEISKSDHSTAIALGERLKIDRGYMSRILKKAEARGLITRIQSPSDNRFQHIRITDGGRRVLEDLNGRSEAQLTELIRLMPDGELSALLNAMDLVRFRFSEAASPATIRGYRPGDEAYIIRRHGELYKEEYNLSDSFCEYVDEHVRLLAENLDPEKECILIPEIGGKPMGSIAIARFDDETAQLRYFLLEPEARGLGLGNRLVDEALRFSRRAGYKRVFLTTIDLLTSARAIYKSKGFTLTDSQPNSEFRRDAADERWDMAL
jgi:DNA-binding MarR family transcriptional regulator/N-acetylglutamate synthase-like GNAT family acetyltransferase